MKKDAVIIDIDGTLSHADHRLHFIENKPKDWDRFFEAMPHDEPQEWCVFLLSHLDCTKILLTGRPEDYRAETEAWLAKHGVSYDLLYMRKSGDFRKDTIIKKEFYVDKIKDHFEVKLVVDDLDHVIEMWRSVSLSTLKIYPKL